MNNFFTVPRLFRFWLCVRQMNKEKASKEVTIVAMMMMGGLVVVVRDAYWNTLCVLGLFLFCIMSQWFCMPNDSCYTYSDFVCQMTCAGLPKTKKEWRKKRRIKQCDSHSVFKYLFSYKHIMTKGWGWERGSSLIRIIQLTLTTHRDECPVLLIIIKTVPWKLCYTQKKVIQSAEMFWIHIK